MNRLYKPRSAVGVVLLEAYGNTSFWADGRKEWEALYKSDQFRALRSTVADLVTWKVDGAETLYDQLDDMEIEAQSPLSVNYPNLLKNFKQLEREALAAHADWLEYGELQQFADNPLWRKVSESYWAIKDIPRSWVDPEVHRQMREADEVFLRALSQADYKGAEQALRNLLKPLDDVRESARSSMDKRMTLLPIWEAQLGRQEKVEGQVFEILELETAKAFFESDAGRLVLAMRLGRSQVQPLLKIQPGKAEPALLDWGQMLQRAEAAVAQALEAYRKQGAQADAEAKARVEPEAGLRIELDEGFTEVHLVPDPVTKQADEAMHLVAPRNDDSQPSIAELKVVVKEAYRALEASTGDKGSGPLFGEFQRAYDQLMRAAAKWDAAHGQASRLAEDRVQELSRQGLLKAMRNDEKMDLLTTLRSSTKPMLQGNTISPTLTATGKAQLDLLASFEMSPAFLAKDQQRRQAVVQGLLAADGAKLKFKGALMGWIGMPEADRFARCQDLVSTQCKVLGIKDCPLQSIKDRKELAGYFSAEKQAICINTQQESAFHFSFEAVSNTLFHETSHWWQHCMVQAFNNGEIAKAVDGQPNPDYEQIMLFALNDPSSHDDAYVSSGPGGDAYRKQPMEAHAYDVGDQMQQMFLEALLT